MRRETCIVVLGLLVLALVSPGCGKQTVSLNQVFPGAHAIAGWTPTGDVRIFDHETIYDLVDGQADAFFAYGFEQVAVQRYEDAAGDELDAEVWQLTTSANAYGLFTAGIAGEPVNIGNEGDGDPGRRTSFWQARYYVQIYGRQQLGDAVLSDFAKAIALALPAGGERPVLVGRLPQEGLVERGFRFFHEEISIQDEIWLGGENVLGLSQETDGILARYDLGDGMGGWLLLVEYPDASAASVGLAALEAGQFDDIVAADAHGNLLGAVSGVVDETVAQALLDEVLK